MVMSSRIITMLVSGVVSFLTLCLVDLAAQDSVSPSIPQRVVGKVISQNPPAPPAEGKPAQQDAGSGDPKKADQKAGEKPAEKSVEKAEPGRPRRKPREPAAASELNVRAGSDGRVSFSFRGQDWEDVLEWLADISGLSLQMEEVPPGFLNLTSRGRHGIDQVMDLFNGVLISKGYTIIRNDELLMVTKLEKLDKSILPRVDPEDLDQRGTHEFVKCFFDLDSLVAETTAEEIKAILSPHGKITALKTTNRLDIVETAGNLRRIRDFLAEEQSDGGKKNILREFKLHYVRAPEVFETLHAILGLRKPGPQVALTPDQIAQMQQAFMQAAQQAAAQGGKAGGAKSEKEVYLAMNTSENSILANAPPDKIAIIEQAVKAMDIPKNRSESLLSNLPRLRSYKLTSVDPSSLVKVLQDLGNLDPQTRLEVDARSRSIIAFATPIDHVTIQAIVDKIDGTGRHFEVIRLSSIDAEMAAGSIEFLMRGPDDKQRQRYNPFYYEFGFGPSRQADRDQGDMFRVEADTEGNRLLLYATEAELKEVKALLAKLGELPEDERSRQTVRVLPMSPGEIRTLIERIQHAWPGASPNPLKIAPLESPPAEEERDPEPLRKGTSTPGVIPAPKSRASANVPPGLAGIESLQDVPGPAYRAVAIERWDGSANPTLEIRPGPQRDEGETSKNQTRLDSSLNPSRSPQSQQGRHDQREPHSPVWITPGPAGLVITSEDTQALDRLEAMVAELMPNQRLGSKLFYLKNSFCKDVADLLKDIFREGEENKKPNPFMDDMYYYYRFGPGSRDQVKEKGRLSRRRPLKFTPDPVTNTILVQGADPTQLAEIERLIQIYDEGVRHDSNAIRVTKQLSFQYTTAQEVSEVIKDVFRDLLSPNDKALVKPGQPQQQEQAKAMYSTTYIFGSESEHDNARKFKGLLSLGVDDRSNTLIVSAPKDLLSIIMEIAEGLDRAAGESRGVLRVLQVGSGADTAAIQRVLSGISKQPRPSSQPPQEPSGEKGKAAQRQPGESQVVIQPQ